MSSGSVWDEVLDTEHAVVVRTYIERVPRKDREPEKVLIIVVEPDQEHRCRCPECGRRCKPVESDVRRWRTLDVHGKRCFLESELPRVDCPEHGKITAAVPWARHDDRFCAPFEAHAAWLAAHVAWTRASAELRVTWEALAHIVARVAADAAGGLDRLAGLTMIGIDEKSWGKGEDRYLTIVTNHVTGKIAWMTEGRSQDTVRAFFDALGPDRARLLTHVSADGAEWIHDVIREKAPRATICLDAFHVVKWAGERLDELRRRLAAELRAAGHEDRAATLGSGLWALRKKPENLTGNQRTALAAIAADNKPLYKGYLIKEQLREAFKVKGGEGRALLNGLIAWAARCRIPEFIKLAKTLTRFKDLICATLDGGPSNGRAEALNAQVNALITRERAGRACPPGQGNRDRGPRGQRDPPQGADRRARHRRNRARQPVTAPAYPVRARWRASPAGVPRPPAPPALAWLTAQAASEWRSPVNIDEDQIVQLLRSQGQDDHASQADNELPGQVDTGNAEHAGMLAKYGIDPATIGDKLGGLGKMI